MRKKFVTHMSEWESYNETVDDTTSTVHSAASTDPITSEDIDQLRQLALDEDFQGENGENNAARCSYCQLDSPQSIMKCDICDKWFCNTKTGGSSSSHIVTHLTISRHKQVSLHEESDLGETTLECYNCGNNNIFNLGYISAIQEQVVVILCSLPCSQLKDQNWDSQNWKSLIDERQFLPWIADIPTEDELINTRMVNYQQIMKLETEWKSNKDARIDDISRDIEDGEEDEVLPILMRYSDAYQYQRSFAPLINLESDYDKSLKESQSLEHISVKWSLGLNNKHLAAFSLSSYESSGLKVNVGEEMILRYNGILDGGENGWEGKGFIVRLPDSHQEFFTLELNHKPKSKSPPVNITTGFTIEFLWKGTSYERMQEALTTFAVEETCCSSYIYHKILGHDVRPIEFDVEIPQNLSISKFANLNNSQSNAVETVLKRPLSLIQGPPGTGKTVTSATIIYHLQKLNKGQKILVCAPSNVAVDHLVEKLDSLNLNVLRLTAKSREDVETSVDHVTLHSKIVSSAKGQLKGLIKLKNSVGELSSKDSDIYYKLMKEKEQVLLKQADIICCTCIGAADRRLQGIKFRTVLVDESSQATEPEMLIPITKGARQVILVGDHQQLGPVVLDKKAGNAGLRQSLFERLILLGHVPIRLEVQYRMNPFLSEFASNMFYEGSLQDGVTVEDRVIANSQFPWPIQNIPMMFWGNFGKEEISGSGSSYLNRVEAMNVEKIITRLFKDGVRPEQIGVITPYEGQRAFIVQYLTLNGTMDVKEDYLSVEVASVDAFQGREKDFIILSCVRASEQSIGFLKDPRRLNVALTRAKYGLVILGNFRALAKSFLWNHLLIHYREKGCLVEGSLENLKLSMIQLVNQSKKYENTRGLNSGLNSVIDGPQSVRTIDTMETKWPALGEDVNSSFYKNLSKLDEEYGRVKADVNDDDIKSIASSFAAGFNLG